MFKNIENVYALLIGNSLESCRNDVKRMKILLEKCNYTVIQLTDTYPRDELLKFIKDHGSSLKTNDLFYFHYSGHGKITGQTINGKMEMVSGWMNPDGSLVHGWEINSILVNIPCQILLVSDSCHSEGFGNYCGDSPYVFIGSSSLIEISKEYSVKGEKTGILTCLLERIISRDSLSTIPTDELLKRAKFLFGRYCKNKPIIKFKNLKNE